jgi:tuftelin-interacting protein 11
VFLLSVDFERLTQVDAIVTEIASAPPGGHDLDRLSTLFEQLQVDYGEEYRLLSLSDLAVALVFPALRRALEHWNPLTHPATGAEVRPPCPLPCSLSGLTRVQMVSRWRYILARARSVGEDQELLLGDSLAGRDAALASSSTYVQLIVATVLPRMRVVFTNEWAARDAVQPLRMLEVWHGLLPPAVLENVLAQLVLPKLQQEVDAWKPRSDPVPIHAWLLPWLPHLGAPLPPPPTPSPTHLTASC